MGTKMRTEILTTCSHPEFSEKITQPLTICDLRSYKYG